MDKNILNRLRTLAGSATPAPKQEDNSRRNMYEIRDLMEARLEESKSTDRARYDADDKANKKVTLKKAPWEKEDTNEEVKELDEADKPDFADIDGDGDEEETAKKAAKDKEKADEGAMYNDAEMMREWANSVYKQYEDRGHYQEQPDGETIDLSLRRYLDAEAHPVKIEEDYTVEGMLKEYKDFKRK